MIPRQRGQDELCCLSLARCVVSQTGAASNESSGLRAVIQIVISDLDGLRLVPARVPSPCGSRILSPTCFHGRLRRRSPEKCFWVAIKVS